MASFAVEPPPTVDVICFFVSRLLGDSDIISFTDAMITQLGELTNEEVSPSLPQTFKLTLLHRMLEQAANSAHARGRSLLMIVDGLDEDTGPLRDVPMASIASQLPSQRLDGLKVIATGRPAGSVPADVPEDHPLRWTTQTVLDPSPHARDVRDRARAELEQLLGGSRLEQQVIGLLTASEGSLTEDDLVEISGLAPFRISITLKAAARAFRATTLDDDLHRKAYRLGHEDLREQATAAFGHELQDFRSLICDWAGTYSAQAWPESTPVYLLRDYGKMLRQSQDLERLATLAADSHRHQRLLKLTRGDALALIEVGAAIDLVASADSPNSKLLSQLAWHRDALTERNRYVPEVLTSVWVKLGNPERAEMQARVIQGGYRGSRSLSKIAIELARSGDTKKALNLIRPPTQSPRQQANEVDENGLHPGNMTALAHAMVAAGDESRAVQVLHYAETALDDVRDPVQRLISATGLISSAPECGREHLRALLNRCVNEAKQFDQPLDIAQALVLVAGAAKASGDTNLQRSLLGEALATISRIQEDRREHVIAALAVNLSNGNIDVPLAERLTLSISDPDLRSWAAASVGESWARAITEDVGVRKFSTNRVKAFRHALLMDRLTTSRRHQLVIISALVGVSATTMNPRIIWLFVQRLDSSEDRDSVLERAVRTLVGAGQFVKASKLSRYIRDDHKRCHALVELAIGLARDEKVDKAAQFISRATVDAQTIADATIRSDVLADVVRGLAVIAAQSPSDELTDSFTTSALDTARGIPTPHYASLALARIASELVEVERKDQARALAEEADAAARSVDDPSYDAWVAAKVAVAFSAAKKQARAREFAKLCLQLCKTTEDANHTRAFFSMSEDLFNVDQKISERVSKLALNMLESKMEKLKSSGDIVYAGRHIAHVGAKTRSSFLVEYAVRLIDETDSGTAADSLRHATAVAFAGLGSVSRSQDIADTIGDDKKRQDAFGQIVAIASQVGAIHGELISIADRVESFLAAVEEPSRLAYLSLQLLDYKYARQADSRIIVSNVSAIRRYAREDEQMRDGVLADTAACLSRLARRTRSHDLAALALATTREIQRDAQATWALANTASAMSTVGDLSLAEQLASECYERARRLSSLDVHAVWLLDVAEILGQVGERQLALRLLAKLWTVVAWPIPLAALARISPTDFAKATKDLQIAGSIGRTGPNFLPGKKYPPNKPGRPRRRL